MTGSAVINMGFIIVHSLICGSSIQAAVRKAISKYWSCDGNFYPSVITAPNQWYLDDIASVMAASVKLWAPAGFVNFLFVPRHLRVAGINIIAFIWNVYLSSTLN